MSAKMKLISITIFCCLIMSFSLPVNAETSHSNNNNLKMHFIDVGQGDAIFIQSPEGKNILIDSGPYKTKQKVISFLKDKGVKTLDLVIVTHPHGDHIGSMPDILQNFKVDRFYMSDLNETSAEVIQLQKAIFDHGIFVLKPHLDESIELEKNLVFKFIAPTPGIYESINEYSNVIQVTYKKNRFLLMGDAGEQSEAEMMHRGIDLKADVIKISHHGGPTGNTLPFLRAVNPQIAVISTAGPKNYPSEEVNNRLRYLKVPVYRTDLHGTIIVQSNGEKIWVNYDE
jgi:competence protein ComEC